MPEEIIGTLDAEEHQTPAITADELNPANWVIDTMESDCGKACTPNGCCGHDSDMPESLTIGGYKFTFPCDDITDSQDWDNAVKIRGKLLEVFDFYAKHHEVNRHHP